MITLYALVGLPASGKSTWALTAGAKDRVMVSKDDLRAMLHQSVWSRENEAQVERVRDLIVIDSLAHGRDVVVHDTNLAPRHLTRLHELACLAGERVSFWAVSFLDEPIDVCIERDSKRPASVGRVVIERMQRDQLDNGKREALEALIDRLNGT